MADDVVYINIEEGVKRVMNNAKFYAKMLNKFKADPSFNDLNAALTAEDMGNAQVSAHTLKGLSANLSLTELFKQTLELETQIKAKSVNPNQIATVQNVYTQTLVEVEKVIAQYG